MPLNRRDFLKQSTHRLAATSTALSLLGKNAIALPSDASDAIRPKFHTRHIPIEHLNLKTEMAKGVVRNGLCDTIKPDTLKRLRDFGVETVEMRVVWWEIEPKPGKFDWSRVLRDMDAVLDAGLKVGMFAWLHYPPAWYDPEHKQHARFRTIDGTTESSVLSPWDPQTLEVFDRLMGISSDVLKDRVSFFLHAITGNYGEFDYNLTAEHYKFSSPIGSYLFGDRCARASFAKAIAKFASQKGRVWLYNDAKLSVLHNHAKMEEIATKHGLISRNIKQIKPTGLYHFTDWKQLASQVTSPGVRCGSFIKPFIEKFYPGKQQTHQNS